VFKEQCVYFSVGFVFRVLHEFIDLLGHAFVHGILHVGGFDAVDVALVNFEQECFYVVEQGGGVYQNGDGYLDELLLEGNQVLHIHHGRHVHFEELQEKVVHAFVLELNQVLQQRLDLPLVGFGHDGRVLQVGLCLHDAFVGGEH